MQNNIVSRIAQKVIACAETDARYDLVQSVFLHAALTDRATYNIKEVCALALHNTSCQAMLFKSALVELNAASYNKESKSITFNFESDVIKALFENAKFKHEEDATLQKMINKRYKMFYLKECC